MNMDVYVLKSNFLIILIEMWKIGKRDHDKEYGSDVELSE